MINVIISFVWLLLSVGVTLLMCQQTNMNIRKSVTSCNINESSNEKQEKLQKQSASFVPIPYIKSTGSILFSVALAILSGVAGYVVSLTGNSTIAIIELGTSYFILLGAAIIDYKLHIIPNYFPIILLIVRVLCFLYELIYTDQALGYLLSSLLGCFACFVLLMIAGKISKGGIGYGDIKLISALGFTCGLLKVFTSLLLSLLLCLIISLLLVMLKKKTMKDQMSFGPYVYFGFLIVLVFNIS